jgi:hypothetical protein
MNLTFLMTPLFAAIAFAAYIQMSSGVSAAVTYACYRRDSRRTYVDASDIGFIVFALMLLAGAAVVVPRFFVYENCQQFLHDGPFACQPGFRLTLTIVSVFKYLATTFILSSCGYLFRALVAHLRANAVRRNELLIGVGVCLTITIFSVLLAHAPDSSEPCGIAGCNWVEN